MIDEQQKHLARIGKAPSVARELYYDALDYVRNAEGVSEKTCMAHAKRLQMRYWSRRSEWNTNLRESIAFANAQGEAQFRLRFPQVDAFRAAGIVSVSALSP